MGVSEKYSGKILHLAYLLEARFRPYKRDEATYEKEKKLWDSQIIGYHSNLFREIENKILNLCDNIAAKIYRYIRRNDIDDARIMDLCNQVGYSKKMELIDEKRATFVELLRNIQLHQNKNQPIRGNSRVVADDAVGAEESIILFDEPISFLEQFQFDLKVTSKTARDYLIFPKTLEFTKLLISLSEIDEILSESKVHSRLMDNILWKPGGIQNFKDKRNELCKNLMGGDRQEYVRDKVVWEKALQRVQGMRLLSIRGLGGYGKTTLARELIYELLARRVEPIFSEYFLISFKSRKQGDFDVKSGKTIEPDTGMRSYESDFEEVIKGIYSELIGNHNPRDTISTHSMMKEIIKLFCNKNCLIVLDNYEDVEADNLDKGDKEKFDKFFSEIEKASRITSSESSCILITSRVPADSSDSNSQLFVNIDLEITDSISEITSRDILLSYLDLEIKKNPSKMSDVEKSRNNMENPDNGWKATLKETSSKFHHGYVQNIMRYPTVIQYIANQMIVTRKPPKTVVTEFLEKMLEGEEGDFKDGSGLVGVKLVNYVISKSYEMLIPEPQRDMLPPLIAYFKIGNHTISFPKFYEIYEEEHESNEIYDLWDKLDSLKFLTPVKGDNTLYQVPPLHLSFLTQNVPTNITADKFRVDTLEKAFKILTDSDRDSFKSILKEMKTIVKYKAIEIAPISAIANCLLNTCENILNASEDDKSNWLKINEYVERESVGSISDKNTRITAGNLLADFKDHLYDYPATISSIVRQLNFEISDNEEIFRVIEEHYLNQPPVEFDPGKDYEIEQTIIFSPGIEDKTEEIIVTSDRSVFSIVDNEDISSYFVFYGEKYKLDQVLNSTVLITRTGQSKVYDIIVIGPNETKSAKPEKIDVDVIDGITSLLPSQDLKTRKVIEIIKTHKIFRQQWGLGHLALSRINKYLGEEKLELTELKKIMQSHSDFEVDSDRVGGVNKDVFLVKLTTKDEPLVKLCDHLGIPKDVLIYGYLFELMYQIVSNNRGQVVLDKQFEVSIKKYCLEKGIKIDWEQIKKIIGMMERGTRERDSSTLSFSPQFRTDKDKFVQNCLARFREGISKKLSNQRPDLLSRNTKQRDKIHDLKNSIPKLIENINSKIVDEISDIESKGSAYSEKIKERIVYSPVGTHNEKIEEFVPLIVDACKKKMPLGELRKKLAWMLGLSNSKTKKTFIFDRGDNEENRNYVTLDEARDSLVVLLQLQKFWEVVAPGHKAISKTDAERIIDDIFKTSMD
jgi:hypothetical protein